MPRALRHPSTRRRRGELALALLAVSSAAGCATWPAAGGRVAVTLAPVAPSARIAHLAELQSAPAPPGDERAEIARVLDHAAQAIAADLTARLTESRQIELVVAASNASPAIAARELSPLAAVETAPSPASSALRLDVRLVGYGRIERKWLVLLIGSGVVEAAVQGLLVAELAGGWAGAAVAAEELAQEALVWGGGAHLLARFYAPVTLTARLVDPRDERTLWRTWVFSRATRKLRRSLPELERTRRESLLAATAAEASRELALRLERAVRRHRARSSGGPQPTRFPHQQPSVARRHSAHGPAVPALVRLRPLPHPEPAPGRQSSGALLPDLPAGRACYCVGAFRFSEKPSCRTECAVR